MTKEINLVYGCITSRDNQKFYLNIFRETGLVKPGKIWVDVLEQNLKYNIGSKIDVYDWVEDKDGYSSHMQKREDSFSISTLIKECDEVREFARLYFPEYII